MGQIYQLAVLNQQVFMKRRDVHFRQDPRKRLFFRSRAGCASLSLGHCPIIFKHLITQLFSIPLNSRDTAGHP